MSINSEIITSVIGLHMQNLESAEHTVRWGKRKQILRDECWKQIEYHRRRIEILESALMSKSERRQ